MRDRTMPLVYGALLILVALDWSMIGAAMFLTTMDYAFGENVRDRK